MHIWRLCNLIDDMCIFFSFLRSITSRCNARVGRNIGAYDAFSKQSSRVALTMAAVLKKFEHTHRMYSRNEIRKRRCPIPFGKLLLVKEEASISTVKVGEEDTKVSLSVRFESLEREAPLPRLLPPPRED